MSEQKTNALRLLQAAGAVFTVKSYSGGALSADKVAEQLGAPLNSVFKTLVTVGKSGEHYVFMVPAARELDLKKAAAAAKEKSVAMVRSAELLGLTGYVHGGCSPVGMKKQYKTFIDSSVLSKGEIAYSAGRIGLQAVSTLSELQKAAVIEAADIT